MVVSALLVTLLAITTYTDVRWKKIYNWTTYPGILTALALSASATALGVDINHATEVQIQRLGIAALGDSLLGLLACGAIMLVCYVFFPGGVGGGDVKLLAMMGAFLGLTAAFEALLWTFVLGGCLALISLVWRYGLITLLVQSGKYMLIKLRLGGTFQLTDEDRKPLQPDLFLSPSALLAAILVRFRLLDYLSGL